MAASPDKVLDLRELFCPRPAVITMDTLRRMRKGQTLRVVTDDLGTKEGIPAMCRRAGYELLEVTAGEDGGISFLIRK